MSQSPLTASSTNNTDRYLQGWKALNRLLHEDSSFSGRERNCAFLNMDGRHFADVASITGLDFDDDARGLAIVDWDFDGKLDLWFANRTAPRVRLMRNNSDGGNHFLAVKLAGDGRTTNRDAIGARLTLYTAEAPDRPLIRTLRAGEGFLSQSSKWVHFGIGTGKIDRLVVAWPSGQKQTFTGLDADRFYQLTQGQADAVVWHPPKRSIRPVDYELPVSSNVARVVPFSRLPMPRLKYQDWDGQTQELLSGRPVLLTLWASWCPPCLVELSSWATHEQEFKNKGLIVVALSTDGSDGRDRDVERIRTVWNRRRLPFRVGWANAGLLEQVDALRRATLDRWNSLPLPTSLLIDARGDLAFIYHGPISVEQLMKDMDLLQADTTTLRDEAVSRTGRWFSTAPAVSPNDMMSQLLDAGLIDEAIAYLQEVIARRKPLAVTPLLQSRLGDLHHSLAILLRGRNRGDDAAAVLRAGIETNPNDMRMVEMLGQLYLSQRRLDAATAVYAQAIVAAPDNPKMRHRLGQCYRLQRKPREALVELSKAAELAPNDASVRVDQASALIALGELARAMEAYRRALQIDPNRHEALNNLAWIHSTHADAKLRDGAEAVRLAEHMVKLRSQPRASDLDTLAAAYAEAGRFAEAVAAVNKALQLVANDPNRAFGEQLQKRLKLYEDAMPYRE